MKKRKRYIIFLFSFLFSIIFCTSLFFYSKKNNTFRIKTKYINPPDEFNFEKFINDTSICTSSMIIKKSIIKDAKFLNTKICEDYFFKCKILKICNAYCLDDFLTKYRIRKNSVQSSSLKNFYWIWKINKDYNKLNFVENFISLLFISFNSLKKYGGKNFF